MTDWFASKRYGLGSGLPTSWQGWAATLFYVAIMIGAGLLLAKRSPWAFVSIAFTATTIFLVIAAKTTRGGWRWRSGNKE